MASSTKISKTEYSIGYAYASSTIATKLNAKTGCYYLETRAGLKAFPSVESATIAAAETGLAKNVWSL